MTRSQQIIGKATEIFIATGSPAKPMRIAKLLRISGDVARQTICRMRKAGVLDVDAVLGLVAVEPGVLEVKHPEQQHLGPGRTLVEEVRLDEAVVPLDRGRGKDGGGERGEGQDGSGEFHGLQTPVGPRRLQKYPGRRGGIGIAVSAAT